jgi:glycerol-3-phosphate acyltransferase PlsY
MDTPLFTEVITLIAAYLLGSIPTGLLISKVYKLPDPREVGSETIGATNMLRLGDKKAAILTLFLDAFKGSLAVIIALIAAPTLAQFACLLAVIGHIWPVWLGLKGGKGIATAFGAILILSWPLATVCLVTWIAVAATTRYSSLSSLTAVILSPLYTTVLNEDNLVITCLVLACLIFWTHRSNIKRLITGKESQIGNTTLSETPQD